MIEQGTAPLAGIIDDQDCACLERVEQSCVLTAEVLEACKRAGFNVSKAETENGQQLTQARAIRREAFPGKA